MPCGTNPFSRPPHWTPGLLVVVVAAICVLVSGGPRGCQCADDKGRRIYTNHFAVCIHGGTHEADAIANRHGFRNKGQIGNLPGCFTFTHHRLKKRSLDYSHEHHRRLKDDPQVLWVEQQHVKKRTKRDLSVSESRPHRQRGPMSFSDPLYPQQWYLNRGARGGYDMNVKGAWQMGYSGKGVVVTILDDGIQPNHPDLAKNYDPLASSDINDNDDDPTPQDNGDNKHGTRCAGEVAAEAGNEFCGVGVAYNASIGGVRMLDGTVTDEVEAHALSLNPNHIDIYSASWGPEDDGKTVDGPGTLAKRAFTEGVTKGRNGLGSIFVWASGNGGRYMDNCNCDGYTNSIYTLSISSATQSGLKPWYLEECSSTLATTYSSGTPRQDGNVITVDMDTSYFRALRSNTQPDPSRLCTHTHTGTSASAPIAAAICALALEANPLLTWRDMQYLVMLTSNPEPLAHEEGWVTNGVRRKVNHKFGYGLMDATEMVRLAEHWVSVPPQHVCSTPPDARERVIPSLVGEELEVLRDMTDGCEGTPNEVRYLEHVQVQVTLQYHPRGSLHITLVSPAGTESSVLMPRPHDTQESAFDNWAFLSVHFWGESPAGRWRLRIRNEGKQHANRPGKLKRWALIFRGTSTAPFNASLVSGRSPRPSTWRRTNRDHKYASSLAEQNSCAKESKFQLQEQFGKCVERCPEGQFGNWESWLCQACHPTCLACYGPNPDNCLKCEKGTFLSGDKCIEVCPDGYYADASLEECLPCVSQCATCESSPDSCTSCRDTHYDHEGQCVPTCPTHTHPTPERKCVKCHPRCESCRGPSERECVTCLPGEFHLNGTCVPHCPDRLYYLDRVARACMECRTGCEACQDDARCTRCLQGWQATQDGGCSPPPSTEAEQCPQAKCKVCKGKGVRDCLQCYPGRVLVEGRCERVCPEGFYPADHSSECLPCHETCASCKMPGQCTSCRGALVLHDGECLVTCPSSMYRSAGGQCKACSETCSTCVSGGPTGCTSCVIGRVLLEGACVEGPCPEGFYLLPQGRECMPCHRACRTCTGASPLRCSSCHHNSTVRNGTCLTCLDREYLDDRSQQCKKCHPSCATCLGPASTQCASCPSPLHLDPATNSCVPCCGPHGGSPCCACNPNTGTCWGVSGHTRSISSGREEASDVRAGVVAAVLICLGAVFLYFVIFGALQLRSSGVCRRRRRGAWDYEKVPNGGGVKYDRGVERVSLTQAIEEDDDEEDDIFEKKT